MAGLLLAAAPALAGERVAAPELAARIVDFLGERGAARDAIALPPLSDFEVESSSGAPLAVELRSAARAPLAGQVPVTVSIRENGVERKHGVVTARVARHGHAWVATRRLVRGATLQAADFRRVDVSGALPADAIGDPGAFEGWRATRGVRPGSVWRASMLERAPRVRRGDRVRVVVESGALRVEMNATAREDGYAGDRIRVLNSRSHRELVGRVRADGVVDVSP